MRSANDLGIPGFETVSVLVDSRDTVLRARRSATGQEVIIKLLDRAKEPVLPNKFSRPRRQLLKLSEKNVGLVPLLEHGVAKDGRAFIVAPYYPIGSLQDQMDHGPTPWYLAAEIVASAAAIVGKAHDDGLVLGDVRPSSIFLEEADKPAVAAFGVATRRFDDGGPSFVAPETATDRPELTPASDVYSLALVLAALIAGRPWARSEAKEEFLAEVRTGAPVRVTDVIEHGLSVSPTNRYGHAGTLERAIRAAMDAGPGDVKAAESDEPFDFESMLEPVEGTGSAATASGIPLATNHEALPPGLEDITFVMRDIEAEDQPNESAANSFTEDQDAGVEDQGIDLRHQDDPVEDDDSSVEDDDSSVEDDDHVQAGLLDTTTFEGDDGFSRPSDELTSLSPSPGDGGTLTVTPTMLKDRSATQELDRNNLNGQEPAKELVEAKLDNASEDETSVIQSEELDDTSVLVIDEAEDTTFVLELDDLDEGADPTSALDLDELEDETSILEIDDLELDDVVVDDLEVDDAEVDHVEFDDLEVDDVELDDAGQDELVTTNVANPGAFADDATNVFHDTVSEDSQTEQEPNSDDLPAAAAFVPGHRGAARKTEAIEGFDGVVGPDGKPLEEVPFRGITQARTTPGELAVLERVRTSVELLWFRRRRSVATAAALLGLAAIGAIAIYFLVQEVRPETRVNADGVPERTTTTTIVAPSTTQLVTNGPSVSAPSTTTTTRAPRRRVQAAPAAPAQTDDAQDGQNSDGTSGGETTDGAENQGSDDQNNSDQNNNDQNSSDQNSGDQNNNDQNSGDQNNGNQGNNANNGNQSGDDDDDDDGGDDETEDSPQDADEEAPPTPTTPPVTEAPRPAPTPEALPPAPAPVPPTPAPAPAPVRPAPAPVAPAPAPTQPPVTEAPLPDRPTISLGLGAVNASAATVTVTSDQCVDATFVLSGEDGSTAQRSSTGACRTDWTVRLNAANGTALTPGTAYSLRVQVTAPETGRSSGSTINFVTAG